MSACAPIARSASSRAGDEILPVHLAVEEDVEQRPDPLRPDRLRRRLVRSAPRKPGASSVKSRPCASSTQSAKWASKWSSTSSQSVISSGRLDAVEASGLSNRLQTQRASTSCDGDVERLGAGDQVRLVRLEEAQHRGEQRRVAEPARAGPPASARSAPAAARARAVSPSVQPSARSASPPRRSFVSCRSIA